MKSHGSANIEGFANAIGVAHDLIADDIQRRIAEDLETFQAQRGLPDADQREAAE